MPLTFLRQPYETNTATVEPAQAVGTGLYRGNPVRFSRPHTAPRSNLTLTYRGSCYSR